MSDIYEQYNIREIILRFLYILDLSPIIKQQNLKNKFSLFHIFNNNIKE
ncbi:hypothetical protein pb186bvf_017178 [Paramecium bursaria]